MTAWLDQQNAGFLAERLEGVPGMVGRHGTREGAIQRVARQIPEWAARVSWPLLKELNGFGDRLDLLSKEAGAVDQYGRGDFHRTQRAEERLVA